MINHVTLPSDRYERPYPIPKQALPQEDVFQLTAVQKAGQRGSRYLQKGNVPEPRQS